MVEFANTPLLRVAYESGGPQAGYPVFLLHGWPDDVRLSDIEDRFVCTACGKRGADVRGDPNWGTKSAGY